MKTNSFFKKISVLLIVTLAILFFVNMAYRWVSTTTETDIEYNYTENIVEVPIPDVEAFAKKQKNGITAQGAENLCREVLGDKAEETGFLMSYGFIGAVSTKGELYYVMRISWLVDNSHLSYIGNCYVSSDGQEIYDGFVAQDKYEIAELLWKK